MRFRKFLLYLKSDLVQAKILNKKHNLNIFKLIKLFIFSKTFRVHFFIRLKTMPNNKYLSYIADIYLKKHFIEIGKDTKIGYFFFLPHPMCIIIAGGVKLGNHVHVGQFVTIGGNFKKIKILKDGHIQKLPIIGNRVMIHPGAVIGGPVNIGNDVIVGANSVVTKDIPSNKIVYGQNVLSKKKIKIQKEGGKFEVIE